MFGVVYNRAADTHVEERFLQIRAAVTNGKGGISVMHAPGRIVAGGYEDSTARSGTLSALFLIPVP